MRKIPPKHKKQKSFLNCNHTIMLHNRIFRQITTSSLRSLKTKIKIRYKSCQTISDHKNCQKEKKIRQITTLEFQYEKQNTNLVKMRWSKYPSNYNITSSFFVATLAPVEPLTSFLLCNFGTFTENWFFREWDYGLWAIWLCYVDGFSRFLKGKSKTLCKSLVSGNHKVVPSQAD